MENLLVCYIRAEARRVFSCLGRRDYSFIRRFPEPILKRIARIDILPISYFIVGYALISIIITAILFITGYPNFQKEFTKANSIPQDKNELITILKVMNDRLFLLAHKEAKRFFNRIRYSLVLNEINKHLGIIPDKIHSKYDLDEAKAITAKIEREARQKTLNKTLIGELPRLGVYSSYLETKNYGLKKARNTDWQYVLYKDRVDVLKNQYGDDELGRLIILHLDASEIFSNMLLMKERSLRVRGWGLQRDPIPEIKRANVADTMSFEAQVRTENIEKNFENCLSSMRLQIGKRLKQIDSI